MTAGCGAEGTYPELKLGKFEAVPEKTKGHRSSEGVCTLFSYRGPEEAKENNKGFTLAQKMVGRACGVEGIRPGIYCEPRMSTVGSQDTTGPMTRDEMKELASAP